MPARGFASIVVALLIGSFVCGFHVKQAEALPDGFGNELVASIPGPTALDFTPDGRMLVASKPGQLFVRDGGQTVRALNMGPRICSNSERGLLGVAVDPDFEVSGHKYVYVYYTAKLGKTCDGSRNEVNRVSRFTMAGNTLAGETVLINNIPSPNGNHNGGDLQFGHDKNLYVSVGDGGCNYLAPNRCQYENNASRYPHVLLGKVLRITRDGGIPQDNPYTGTNSARCNVEGRTAAGNRCRETFASGFRNPFRFAVDPDATVTVLRINDVGGKEWEEIDQAQVGTSDDGNDYGWNLCEGRHDNPYRAGSVDCSGPNYTGPIEEYSHGSGCESITGAAFVPNGFWPAAYDDSYLFGDYVCGKIFRLTPQDGGGLSRTEFATGLGQGGPIAMDFGPYKITGKALYYTTFAGGGQVRRIVHSAGNVAPVAQAKANPPYAEFTGDLTIDFGGSGSSDPDANTPLTYGWDFTSDGTVDSTEANAQHTYPSGSKYTAALTVTDSKGKASEPSQVDVFPGDTPPEPVIQSPIAEATFKVGGDITLGGSAADAEDATEPTLEWEVLRHHDGNHAHPWFGPVRGDNLTFEGPAPEGLFSTNPAKNYLELRLTATDSLGLGKTVTRELRPKTTNIQFQTQPPHFRLSIAGDTFRAPRTFLSWEGARWNIYAPRQRHDGRTWVLRRWSDGGGTRHTIITPVQSNTYTATFRALRR